MVLLMEKLHAQKIVIGPTGEIKGDLDHLQKI